MGWSVDDADDSYLYMEVSNLLEASKQWDPR